MDFAQRNDKASCAVQKEQGSVGEKKASKGELTCQRSFARWRLSGNALKH